MLALYAADWPRLLIGQQDPRVSSEALYGGSGAAGWLCPIKTEDAVKWLVVREVTNFIDLLHRFEILEKVQNCPGLSTDQGFYVGQSALCSCRGRRHHTHRRTRFRFHNKNEFN